MRHARQRDINERPIITALRAAGCAVSQLDGAGVPDLAVSRRGMTWLLEVKNPDAKGGGKYNTGDGCLTDAQMRWWAKWRAEGGVMPSIVYTVEQALAVVGGGAWALS